MTIVFLDGLTWNYMNKNFNVAEMKQPNTLGKYKHNICSQSSNKSYFFITLHKPKAGRINIWHSHFAVDSIVWTFLPTVYLKKPVLWKSKFQS